MNEKDQVIQDLNSQLSTLQKDYDEVKTTTKIQYDGLVEKVGKIKKEARAEAVLLKIKIQQAETDIKNEIIKTGIQEKLVEQQSNKINELNIEIEELKSRLSKMNDSHYEITEKYQQSTITSETSTRTVSEEKNQFLIQMQELAEKYQQLKVTASTMEDENINQQQQLHLMTQQIQQQTLNAQSFEEHGKQLQDQNQNLKKELKELSEQLKQSKMGSAHSNEDQQREHDELIEKIQILQSASDNDQQLINMTNGQIDELTVRLQELKKQQKIDSENVKKLTKSLKLIQKKADDLQVQHDKLIQDHENCGVNIQNEKLLNNNLQTNLNDLIKQLSESIQNQKLLLPQQETQVSELADKYIENNNNSDQSIANSQIQNVSEQLVKVAEIVKKYLQGESDPQNDVSSQKNTYFQFDQVVANILHVLQCEHQATQDVTQNQNVSIQLAQVVELVQQFLKGESKDIEDFPSKSSVSMQLEQVVALVQQFLQRESLQLQNVASTSEQNASEKLVQEVESGKVNLELENSTLNIKNEQDSNNNNLQMQLIELFQQMNELIVKLGENIENKDKVNKDLQILLNDLQENILQLHQREENHKLAIASQEQQIIQQEEQYQQYNSKSESQIKLISEISDERNQQQSEIQELQRQLNDLSDKLAQLDQSSSENQNKQNQSHKLSQICKLAEELSKKYHQINQQYQLLQESMLQEKEKNQNLQEQFNQINKIREEQEDLIKLIKLNQSMVNSNNNKKLNIDDQQTDQENCNQLIDQIIQITQNDGNSEFQEERESLNQQIEDLKNKKQQLTQQLDQYVENIYNAKNQLYFINLVAKELQEYNYQSFRAYEKYEQILQKDNETNYIQTYLYQQNEYRSNFINKQNSPASYNYGTEKLFREQGPSIHGQIKFLTNKILQITKNAEFSATNSQQIDDRVFIKQQINETQEVVCEQSTKSGQRSEKFNLKVQENKQVLNYQIEELFKQYEKTNQGAENNLKTEVIELLRKNYLFGQNFSIKETADVTFSQQLNMSQSQLQQKVYEQNLQATQPSKNNQELQQINKFSLHESERLRTQLMEQIQLNYELTSKAQNYQDNMKKVLEINLNLQKNSDELTDKNHRLNYTISREA